MRSAPQNTRLRVHAKTLSPSNIETPRKQASYTKVLIDRPIQTPEAVLES